MLNFCGTLYCSLVVTLRRRPMARPEPMDCSPPGNPGGAAGLSPRPEQPWVYSQCHGWPGRTSPPLSLFACSGLKPTATMAPIHLDALISRT